MYMYMQLLHQHRGNVTVKYCMSALIQCLSEQNDVNSSFPGKVNNLLLDTYTA